MREDFVFVDHEHNFEGFSHCHENQHYEILIPKRRFHLGMTRRDQLLRQLKVDLPRSSVLVHGKRVVDEPWVVYKQATDARLCTQAVMAPALELMFRSNLLAHELPQKEQMKVLVGGNGEVLSQKSLGVIGERQHGNVDISVYGDHKYVVTGFEFRGWEDRDVPT